ncbi:tetratricopeptide repeat protein (macronuclear) [Tetrahymena thermophila SB210]|uniref:Tetratricopeptide repeat protein n=1 Tax=Tetrahymena thermophila (strain SB210) TaxID=312017 RepID=I7M1B8_TETTS|nr:tetratricopeptide repeat protein [Tetrahymena thermophila SB210]EAR96022.2 tetratricopeptide repeat protein [Tetrahymena thermophila SB210]|eukprot:XP_001016267.2 tetratricopeptide repeat protein [Tetrahymena thermophila SB210]
MQRLIIRLILTVSIPIIIGVAISMLIFYKNLMSALLLWESDSLQWIKQSYQQTLYNQLLSKLIIQEYSFNQIQLQLIVMNKLIDKFNNKKIQVNVNTQFTVCSYREIAFNQCISDVYQRFNQSCYFVDIYFVRTLFRFDLLSQHQQNYILMNNYLSFFSKSVHYQSQRQGLLKIMMFFNADTTSVFQRFPSELVNVTNTAYQDCYGDGYLEPYDPRCRPWYTYAKQNEGYFFYQPYNDAVQKNLVMTLSSQVKFGSNIQSVNSIAFDMTNLIEIFVSSQNQYSVLFHEFNNTIFHHPYHNDNSVISWQELEFKNITQNNLTEEDFEKLNQEKQDFSNQLQQTIQFIKSGNYSINQQKNLDQLYQYWSKFGIKKISLVFPLVSQIPKYKTQQPYSFSIILTAMVIEDQSNRLQLLNIININWIRVPLIVEFIVVSLAIILFLLNYGKFQIIQIQNPIEILIKFLKINLILQRQTKVLKYIKKSEKQSLTFNRYKKISQNINSKLKQEETTNKLLSPCSQDSFKLTSKYVHKTNQQNYLIQQEKITRNKLLSFPYSDKTDFSQKFDSIREKRKTRLSFLHNSKTIISTSRAFNQQDDEQQGNPDFFINRTSQNDDKSAHSLKNESQIQSVKLQKYDKQKKSKILDELEPLFLEMKIIKDTFQNLESLINYQIDAQSQNSEDIMNALFHFAKAKCTFQKLQNQNGVIHCYYNLGVIYLIKSDFQLASEYFLSAIQFNCMCLGIDYQQLEFFHDNEYKDQLVTFKKIVLCYSYSLKQHVLEQIYSQIKSNLFKSQNKFNNIFQNYQQEIQNEQVLKNTLKESIDNFRILENLVKIQNQNAPKLFELFINLEIIEILIHLDHINQKKEIQLYIQKSIVIINKLQFTFIKPKNFNSKIFDEDESVIFEEEDISFSLYNNFQNISQEIRFIIFEICKSKLIFLQGKLEFYKQNDYLAIQYLTQSLEEGQFFSPIQRQNVILYLSLLFQKLSIKQDLIDELALNSSTPINLILLIQLDSISQNTNLNQFFENIEISKFLRKKDGIQIIIFNKQLQTVIPLTEIESFHHLQLIVENFKYKSKVTIQKSKKTLQKLNWQQAIVKYASNIAKLNLLQISKLKQIIKELNNSKNDQKQKLSFEIFKKNMKMLESKKQVIILFSKEQDVKNNIKPKQFFNKKIQFHFQKIIIYHMLDLFIQKDNDQNQLDSEYFEYEPILSDKVLIQKLSQLRKDYLNSSKEFLTIINNAL